MWNIKIEPMASPLLWFHFITLWYISFSYKVKQQDRTGCKSIIVSLYNFMKYFFSFYKVNHQDKTDG